jgi:S1-C subfamily serine protease
VVEDLSSEPGVGQEVGVFVQDDQMAVATVVGVHRDLDLALLWVGRGNGETRYLQPLRTFVSVEVGEQVFAIGHPQGLAFSISSGLVAQKRGDDHVQISAPVSPGNSGGPVFDRHGRLIGIVESVIDKEISPNAENLNFAVRVDDLFVADAWILDETGRTAMDSIAAWDEEPASAEEDTETNTEAEPEA